MYPSRYGDSSYAKKFDLPLCLGRKLGGLERMEKLREANKRLQRPLFFSGGRQLRVPLAAYVAFLNRLYDAKEE
jgi:hypothetical protein